MKVLRSRRLTGSVVMFFLSGSFFFAVFASQTLPLQDSISYYGITWKFTKKVPIGRFVTGEYYVVDSVTVKSISPAPANGRNGSVLNVPLNPGKTGFDSRATAYDATLRKDPPINLKPGDALISTISLEDNSTMRAWLSSDDNVGTKTKSAAILTCLSKQVSPDAFRPSYCDREHKIFLSSKLNRDKLLSLPRPSSLPKIADYAQHFQRPWLDVCFFGFDAPKEYMPAYASQIGRAVGNAGLLLNLDFTAAEKEPLLIGMVQYGIDLWGMVRAGYRGWPAHGGHGSGRKWPIIFAGLLFDDPDMQSPTKKYPDLQFGEDMQTMYGTGWTGAKVVYAGHRGVINGVVVDTQSGWGPYEHLHPSKWASNTGESYRRCCTSLSWIAQALAARLMNAIDQWNHNPFFDYIDRWMTENDSAAIRVINEARDWDLTASKWCWQGATWEPWEKEMWNKYRDLKTGIKPSSRKSRREAGICFPDENTKISVYDLKGRKLVEVVNPANSSLTRKTIQKMLNRDVNVKIISFDSEDGTKGISIIPIQ